MNSKIFYLFDYEFLTPNFLKFYIASSYRGIRNTPTSLCNVIKETNIDSTVT